jgi:hypothetical protein
MEEVQDAWLRPRKTLRPGFFQLGYIDLLRLACAAKGHNSAALYTLGWAGL